MLQYTVHKEQLWKDAYPNEDTNEEYVRQWKNGLWPDFQVKIIQKKLTRYEDMLELCMLKETALLQVYGTYGNFTKNKKEEVVKPCRTWQKTGECKFGDSCRFQHSTTSPTTPVKKQDRAPNPLEPCRRPKCSTLPSHAWTACKQPEKPCQLCKSKDHTKHYCSKATCSKCKEPGHTSFVCTKK